MGELIDFKWHQLRALEGAMLDQHIMPWIMQTLPRDVMQFAFLDCFPKELPDELDEELLFAHFFIHWFCYNWIPFEDFGLKKFDPSRTIAQNYLKIHKQQLDSQQKRYIETISKSYYSFYSVLQVDLDRALSVKDILLGSTHKIKERQATHTLKRGDIIFSRILTLDDQSIFVGMFPFVIRAACHSDLLDFKAWLIEENNQKALTVSALRDEFDVDLLDCCAYLMQTMAKRPSPTLINTDGDLVEFARSSFRLTMPPEEALIHLMPMTLSKNPTVFLERAKRTKAGVIKRLEIPWLKKGNKSNKEWDNTLLGDIVIEPGKLILETNSEKRTQKGKKLLMKYLGDAIAFQKTSIKSQQDMLKLAAKSPAKKKSKTNNPIESEAMQEQFRLMAKEHWENWFDEPIPALNNKTPREAAKSPKDRERLEALLLQYERQDLERGDHPFKMDIVYIRAELFLDKE